MKKTVNRVCEICGETNFRNHQHYASHKRRKHPGWRNGGFLPQVESPVTEPEEDNETGANRCDHCGQTFRTRQSLAAHIRWCREHANREETVQQTEQATADQNVFAPYDPEKALMYCPHCGLDLWSIRQVLGDD